MYVYYVHDAAIGGTAPTLGHAARPRRLPDPPAARRGTTRLRRQRAHLAAAGRDGEVMTGPEQVLVEDWCQQYPSHAGGGIEFGADGYLYLSGGDGAASTFWDYGQDGDPATMAPINPCGDPPGGRRRSRMTPPTAEGGRLRARTCAPPATRSA